MINDRANKSKQAKKIFLIAFGETFSKTYNSYSEKFALFKKFHCWTILNHPNFNHFCHWFVVENVSLYISSAQKLIDSKISFNLASVLGKLIKNYRQNAA